MTHEEPDSIRESEEVPVGRDWLPRFTFSLKRLLLTIVAYAIALGAYSVSGQEFVAYGLVPGTTMALVVLSFRRRDLGLLLSVGIGAAVCGMVGGDTVAPSMRVEQVPGNFFTGSVIGAFFGGILGRWLYFETRPKS